MIPKTLQKPNTFLINSSGGFVPYLAPKKNSGFNPKSNSGFNPAVLILENIHKTPQALTPMRCKVVPRHIADGTNSRLLLIAPNHLGRPYSKNKKKPTKKELKKNRKSESKKSSFKYHGITYRVNTGRKEDKAIYLTVVRNMIDQLSICLKNYGRVYAVRLDLHQNIYSGNNKVISQFICNFRKQMLTEYGFNDFGYQWAREIETSNACHYHLVIFFNGYKIKSHWKIRQIAKNVWEKMNVDNTVPYWKPKKYGKVAHDIRKHDHEALLDAVEHFSYLAKARGKGYRDPQSKDYNSSRVKSACNKS